MDDLRPAPHGAPRGTSPSSVREEKTQVRLFVNSQQMASSSLISLVAKRHFFVPLLYVLCARGFRGAAHRVHFQAPAELEVFGCSPALHYQVVKQDELCTLFHQNK